MIFESFKFVKIVVVEFRGNLEFPWNLNPWNGISMEQEAMEWNGTWNQFFDVEWNGNSMEIPCPPLVYLT